MKTFQKFCLLIPLFVFQKAFTQNDSSSNQKPNFKISISYNSGLNYYGRTDSLKSTGVIPMAELWLSKDVYVNAAPVFVNNTVQSMEYSGTITSLGYLHTTDKWISNLYLLKPFCKQSSQLVQSALKAQAGASFSKLNKAINFTFGSDLKFSDKTDLGITAGLDHLVRKQFGKSVLVIDPAFYIYAGTQNFSNTYYKRKAGLLFLPGTTEQVNKNVTKFNVLAYEFSVPVVFAKSNWMFLLNPSYILPQNLVSVSGRPDLSENGQNMFYTTLGLKYSFR